MKPQNMRNTEFRLEALCDFVMDAFVPLVPSHIDDMMKKLRDLGITRLTWNYMADERGGHIWPYDKDSNNGYIQGLSNAKENYKRLGNPLKLAVEVAHKYGIELYGYFKPYETGVGVSYPDGSPEAKAHGRLQKIGSRLVWLDPFVLANPDLRIKRKSGDIPADNHTRPICSIKLRKTDYAPTRLKKENLQIWVSDNNYQYEQLSVDFDVEESIEAADYDVEDQRRTILTRKGDSIRTLTLSGLHLAQPYVLVTTNSEDGQSDFSNTAIDMMRVYDEQGRELVGVYSNGSTIYHGTDIDFRNWGLIFDHGYGCRAGALDRPNTNGREGLIAFARGRNDYLDGALCETEPKVQEFWLECLQAILDAGVDGVDFRIENHSTMTDFSGEYGYNQVVLDRLSDPSNPSVTEIARVRGDAYTDFLHKAKDLISRHGKKMRINFQLDVLRPEVPRNRLLAYPANTAFQWERWIDEGLLDEAIYRFFALSFDEALEEEIGKHIIERCQKHNIPIVFNRYIKDTVVAEFKQIQADERFCGFILYEVYNFISYESDGTCTIKDENILEVSRLFQQ